MKDTIRCLEEGNCYYCNKPVNNLAANPNQWGIPLCHKDEPGKVKPHHIGCVSERLATLKDYERIKGELKRIRSKGSTLPDFID